MMKKIFTILLLLITITGVSQIRKLQASSGFDIRQFNMVWLNGTDSLIRLKDSAAKFFKPVLFAQYSTATAPPATLYEGAMIYNTDSNWHQYSDGSSWVNVPGTGAGGSGGAPGGSATEFQYRSDATTFGGAAGTAWDNTNRLATWTKTNLGVTQVLAGGLLWDNDQAATAGNQQVSPAYWMQGRGWGTTAGTSQIVRGGFDLLPVQGTVPTSLLRWMHSIDGGAITQLMSYASSTNRISLLNSATAGSLFLTSSTTNFFLQANGNIANWVGHNSFSSRASGTSVLVAGSTPADPNGFTNAFLNIVRTTLPQIGAVYDASNYSTFGTNSSGYGNITSSGGRIGIHTASPTANFHVTGGMLKTGTTGKTQFTNGLYNAAHGSIILVDGVVNDPLTAESGTRTSSSIVEIEGVQMTATNLTVTHDSASTLKIENPPYAGTNMTLTNPYSLTVSHGRTYMGGGLQLTNIPGAEGSILTHLNDSTTGQVPIETFVRQYYGKSTAVNGAAVTLITIPTSTDSAYAIRVEYTGSEQDAATVAWYEQKVLVTNNSGTVVVQEQVTEETLESGAPFSHTLNVVASGTDILIQITGDGIGVTQRWTARAKVMPFQYK